MNEARDYLVLARAVSDYGKFAGLGETPAARMLALSASSVRRHEITKPLFTRSGTVAAPVPNLSNHSQQRWRALWFGSIGKHATFRSEQLVRLTLRKLPSVLQFLKRREMVFPQKRSPKAKKLLPQPIIKSMQTAREEDDRIHLAATSSSAMVAQVGRPQQVIVAGEGGGSSAAWARHFLFTSDECATIFDTNAQHFAHNIVDKMTGYCYLCRCPAFNLATHTAYWEHVTRVSALRVCIAYQRSFGGVWQAAKVVKKVSYSLNNDDIEGKLSTSITKIADERSLWCPQRVLTGVVADLRLPVNRAATWAPSFWHVNSLSQWMLYSHVMTNVDAAATAGQRFPKLLPFSTSTIVSSSQQQAVGASNESHTTTTTTTPEHHTMLRLQQATDLLPTPSPTPSSQPRPPSALTAATFVPPPPFAIPALSHADTVRRLDELQALLKKLCHWGVLTFCFRGPERPGIANEGERCFRATVSALLTPMTFPLSAQGQTRWSQKMWGRQTLEMLFDALQVAVEIQHKVFRVPLAAVAKTKMQKAAVMRQMLYQLHSVVDACGRQVDEEDNSIPTPSQVQLLPSPPEDVLVSLCELALHRVAFELIHIRTSILMDDLSGGLWADLGFPTAGEVGDALR
ncbi:Hypothetical protein, putative [Bodo saltans]|uniref:Uncharacterized protein n=1 Tax=Bodo saltans TaxID=75058 RepID=A0A0S4IQT2_BODSA|nr:Hypothetical protein, putative [Bodo saltans]|eukprot:CUF98570.1 Hypothetical protein, putative [Bodo saltans]